MIVIQHNLTGERFMYNTLAVNDAPENVDTTRHIPKNFTLSADQTPVPLQILVNGKVVTRWEAESKDPLKLLDKWTQI